MTWRTYINDRMICDHDDGFSIVVPKDHVDSIPLGCMLCKRLFRSMDDEKSYLEFGCCYLCALKWAHPRRSDWLRGWRPSLEQIADEIKIRSRLSVDFDID